jgi:DNA-binding transcriptional regulator YdaS (Cro superfamily)
VDQPKNPAIEDAYLKAGGRKRVQESLGVTKGSLSDWKRWGYVPVNRCPELERLSGVSRRKLNPIFDWGPAAPAKPVAKAKRKTAQGAAA